MIRVLAKRSDLNKLKKGLDKEFHDLDIDHQFKNSRRTYPCLVAIQVITYPDQKEADALYQFQSMKDLGMVPCINNKLYPWSNK